jgi:hypothetical protein
LVSNQLRRAQSECWPKEILEQRKGRSAGAAAFRQNPGLAGISYLSPSPPEESLPDGAGLGAAGAAQLGAAGAGAGAAAGAGFAAAGAAGLAAAFFLAFFAGFFGAAALDFLADFFADFLADFLAFFADFFEDFFEDFFFAVTAFLLFLDFLPPFFFFALAIVILLFAADQCLSSVSCRPHPALANRSVQSRAF